MSARFIASVLATIAFGFSAWLVFSEIPPWAIALHALCGTIVMNQLTDKDYD